MKKLTVEDVLKSEKFKSLRFFIDVDEVDNFIDKPTGKKAVREALNFSQYFVFDKIFEYTNGDNEELEKATDNYATRANSETIVETLIKNKQYINPDKLMLYLGTLSFFYLGMMENAVEGQGTYSEFCYRNGDIIIIENGEVTINRNGEKIKDPEEIKKIKEELTEGVLIANKSLAAYKNKPLQIDGVYIERGINKISHPLSTDTSKLNKNAKSAMLLNNLDKTKIKQYLTEGLITKSTLTKALAKGIFTKDFAIQLMLQGVFTKDELLKIYNCKKYEDLLKSEDISLETKLMLYSKGNISISELEQMSLSNKEESIVFDESKKYLCQYYRDNINKISELITHRVLDYNSSMSLLDMLEREKVIDSEQKDYIIQVMNDFKPNEIININEDKSMDWNGDGGNIDIYRHKPGLTIDPSERDRYLRSIGAIKQLTIKGQKFLQDDNIKKPTSLDGYKLLIIPEKKIAVLEKFFEVTRDKEGNIKYKLDKEGRKIPSIGNATYILPIGMARDFAEKKNKQELLASPYVKRVYHTRDWVNSFEVKAKDINPQIEFDSKNTERWRKIISDNYDKNMGRI